MEFVGRTVRKDFKGFGIFSGTVKAYDSLTGFFEIVYEDGDSEELEYSEIASLLEGMLGDQSAVADLTKKPSRVGRKPKKRRRFDISGDSGNDSANLFTNSCLNQISDEIKREDDVGPEGFTETLEAELGFGENRDVLMNRNVEIDSNHRLNLNDELNLNDGVNLNNGLDLNVEIGSNDRADVNENEKLKRSDFIDLNLDLNDEDNGNSTKQDVSVVSVVDTWKREHCFDLNLGFDDETKNSDVDGDGQLKKNTSCLDEETQMRESSGIVEGMQMKGGYVNGTSKGVCVEIVEQTPMKGFSGSGKLWTDVKQKEDGVSPGSLIRDSTFVVLDANFENDCSSSEIQLNGLSDVAVHEYQGNSGSTYKGRNGRKRRKLSDSVNSTPDTALRRSTRRGGAAFSDQRHVSIAIGSDTVNDELLSPVVCAVSKEKLTVPGHEEPEEHNILFPKLQLPPSSENLNLEGISVPDFFSVYAFLRSFSTLLFLSPFELEDFVGALRSKAPNLLYDFIHVSLLQTLRKHLKFLCDEGSQSASICLRDLNWDLLDLVTWPIFMVEYLLVHRSGLKPGFDLCHMKLFESDYYKQSAPVKIEILRCLCDDVIEAEAIKSELNRRTLVTEASTDFVRDMKFETSKKRRAVIDVSSGPCLTEEVVDDTRDWNSDECYLCKMDGSLICCDGCPAAFHSRCVGVASSLLPEGDWYCPECVIDKDKPWMRVGNSIRGADLLGIDPHGRLYYSSCDYLLVSDSSDTESSFNYYHRNDLNSLIEALKSSDILHSTIISAITKIWNASAEANATKSDMDLVPSETCVKDETAYEGKPEEKSMISTYSGNIGCKVSEWVNSDPVIVVNHSMKMENPLATSEKSAEIPQAITYIQNIKKTRLDSSCRYAGILNESMVLGESASIGDYSLTSTNLEIEKGKKIQSADRRCKSSSRSRKGDIGQCRTSYVNYYSFARTASLVAEEFTRKSSDKISEKTASSVEDIILAQLKVISNISTEFCWSNIQNLNVDAKKEKCGWCFSCKFPDDDRDCLFIRNDTGSVLESFTSESLGIRSRMNNKGHLIDVICHILFIEARLHGLLSGPWLNPHYFKLWHKRFIRESDVASVKRLLLMLESNLCRLALSAEWLKPVDTVATMGSASHVVTSAPRLSSKHGVARKRARSSDLEPSHSSNAATGLGLFWWRGSRFSRRLFSWKIVPHSLASKAARQAGCKKIPGILYPDSSEFAKRTKYVVWRASVETSRSVEQLALQIRELDANIRWDDIENTNILSKMDKESRKSVRSFKKAIIRRKCSEGTMVKYLLDFGKRRFIPDIVARHGSMLEESSSGRKKYWLEESHVPLNLLKIFEERRIARKSNKMGSGKLHESVRVIKKPSRKRGFSYLFSKVERSENYQCGHCNKDVLIREAVTCQFCEGFFHKRHVRKSSGAITSECTYTCHKCHDGKWVKIEPKKGKSQLPMGKKGSKLLKPVHKKISRKAGKDKQSVQSKKNRKDSVVVPLRRSARTVKCVSLPSKKIVGRKKGKQTKSRKGTLNKLKNGTPQKKRTRVNHTYWLNGLLLSRKPNDRRVIDFRGKKLFAASEQVTDILDQPRCSLCCEPEWTSTLNYVGCEICRDWFHGDAFGLRAENTGNLIGFKCHKCRNRTPPVCPHLHAVTIEKAQLDRSKDGASIDCSDEVSNALAPPNEVHLEQKSCSDVESKYMFSTDGCIHKEQQEVNVPDSNPTVVLDAENGHIPISLEQRTEAIRNYSEKDWRTPDTLVECKEDTSLEDKSIELGEAHVVNVSTVVDTESSLPKSSGEVLTSLGQNHVENGLVKTTATLGSVVNKNLVDSSELPPEETVALDEL